MGNKILRLELLEKIARETVYRAMGEAGEAKLKRCDICDGQPTEGEVCDRNLENSCFKYGFEELHSIDSATKEISKILAGRI